jgi:[ribosomal protein S18]-alanine N-acetyltransferase
MRLTNERKTDKLLDAVLEINRECFPSVRASDDNLTRLFRTGEVFVASYFNAIIGFAVCEHYVVETPRLVIIAVLLDYQHQGIGRELLYEVIGYYSLERCQALALTVNAKNARAIKMYENAGFKQVTLLKRYFLQDGDGILMRREQ